jgi:anti-anti-sigma factor
MDDLTVVRLSGYVDSAAGTITRALLEPLAKAPRAILDLSDVKYIDSSGLTDILEIRRRRDGANLPPVRIVVSSRSLTKRILAIAGFEGVFPIHDSVASAQSADDRPTP